MASKIEIDVSAFNKLNEILRAFTEQGIDAPIKDGAKRITENLKKNIVIGKDINGNFYPPVTKKTMDRPIKFSGPFSDSRIRSDVSTSPTAFDVTGKTRESINWKKVSNKLYEIGYDSARTDLIIQGNARADGNVPKPRRDPLGVTERQPSDSEFDYVADAVEFALERALSGY